MLELGYLLSDYIGPQLLQDHREVLKMPYVGVSIDSRTIKAGEIFFAVKGKHLDGHEFVAKALDAGAAIVVVHEGFATLGDRRIIAVPDSLKCLHALAHKIRTHYHPITIAVTGSVGKTTTKNFIGGIFSEIAATVYSRKSFNNEFGVPLTLCGINHQTKYACIEIGINSFGEMEFLAATVAADIGVITNIGMAHIGRFGSIEAILQEKSKLLDKLRSGGVAVLNSDDERLYSLKADLKAKSIRVIWFGTTAAAEVRVVSREVIDGKLHLAIATPAKQVEVILAPPDDGTLYACLATLGVAIAANLDPQLVVNALPNASIESRLRIRPFPKGRIIDDCYNASASSILNGIALLRESKETPVLVLGDLRELGEFLVESYRQILTAAKAINAKVITIGETAASWQEAAKLSGFDNDKLTSVNAWNQAIELLSQNDMRGNTAIFIKGSRFSHLERVALFMEGQKSTCYKTSCSKYIHCSECSEFNPLP